MQRRVSPAADADLRVDDIILELAGQPVSAPRQLQGIVEKLDVDKEYSVSVIRDGERMRIPITLRAMPSDYTRARNFGRRGNNVPPSEPENSGFQELGIDVQELTPAFAEQLGIEEAGGVLITKIVSGSLADQAGLSAGEVIKRVGGTDVNTPEEFREALENVSLEDGVLLLISSGGDSRVVVVKQK